MSVNSHDLWMGLLGGWLIGLAVTVMLLFNGRVAGISRIAFRFITMQKNDWIWRGFFLLGLVSGGVIFQIYAPQQLENTSNRELPIWWCLVC